ncbi:MAG: 1-acyl-sn-glycerol-3-phosphate acyltransferase [Acidobacteria bacterium]|nr:1-acyl-sn-glycerol-3-phosphate acyltransferase [Acidobacteriota bacterium]
MRVARAFFRLLSLALVTLTCYLVLRLGILRSRLAHRSPLGWQVRMLGAWTRAVSRVIGMRIRGEGPVPSPPFLLVANHLSYVDVVLLASRVRGVFVARGDLAGWPILGWLTRSVGTLYLDRGYSRDLPRVAAEVHQVLSQGIGVFLFPEGTSTDGSGVLPFRPSLLETAVQLGMPVSFASLSYSTPAGAASARLAVCWWGEMTFFRHLWELLSLPGFEGKVTFGDAPIQHNDRKILAASLHEAIRGRFEPVTS